MTNKEIEKTIEQVDAQIAYFKLPYALTYSVEAILRDNPIKRDLSGYFIDLGKQYLFLGPCDLEEYLQWLEIIFPIKAKVIRKRVREADERYFGRNYEAM